MDENRVTKLILWLKNKEMSSLQIHSYGFSTRGNLPYLVELSSFKNQKLKSKWSKKTRKRGKHPNEPQNAIKFEICSRFETINYLIVFISKTILGKFNNVNKVRVCIYLCGGIVIVRHWYQIWTLWAKLITSEM